MCTSIQDCDHFPCAPRGFLFALLKNVRLSPRSHTVLARRDAEQELSCVPVLPAILVFSTNAIFVSVALLGLPLNIVFLWILLSHHRIKSPSTVLMINLALSDLLLVVSLPTSLLLRHWILALWRTNLCRGHHAVPQQHPRQRHLHHLHRRGPTPGRGLR